MAVETLRNKAHWDADSGVVDVWTQDNTGAVNLGGGSGHGYFVLPRFVEAVVSLNLDGRPQAPRNKWFEFHLNGLGETNRASACKWDDAGDVVVTARLKIDPDTNKVIPVNVVAIPDSAGDNGTAVRIYGFERLGDGTEVEVYRDGVRGWLPPCLYGSLALGTNPPDWVGFERITKATSAGFIRLVVVESGVETTQLGFWYPDEVEPKYRAVKINSIKSSRIRVFYRKRFTKISSLFEPLPLKSRRAIEMMLNALKLDITDQSASASLEDRAVKLLSEERINASPSTTGELQFDSSVMPGFNGNIQ